MLVKTRMPHDERIPLSSYLGKPVNNPNAFTGYVGQVGIIVEAIQIENDVEITMQIEDKGESIFNETVQATFRTHSN